jgi:uncharacterized pyridoxamine 5'-phosphate oxidase family protein
VHETPDDVTGLQELLDRSYAAAGEHLRSIFEPQHRIPAADLPDLLTGVQVLSLATVTRRCEPRVAPVDGLFYRAALWFGSSPTSARIRHVRARPQVSATHLRGESLAVVVHGRATLVDLTEPEHAGFRAYCAEVYGGSWEDWGGAAPYARIDPTTMFTYHRRDAG